MALKRISPEKQKLYEESNRRMAERKMKEQEEKMMNEFENERINQSCKETNINEDSFFNEEEIQNSNIYANLSLDEILKANARKANIPEVVCNFKITHVTFEKNALTKNGVKDRIPVDFHLTYKHNEQYQEAMLTQKYNISNHPESNLQKFLRKIRETKSTQIQCLNDLVGIAGTAKIVHATMDDGSVFENLQILTVSDN